MTLAICIPYAQNRLAELDCTGIRNLRGLTAKEVLAMTGENVGNLAFVYGFRSLLADDIVEVSIDSNPTEIRKRARVLLLPCANLVNPEYDLATFAAFIEAVDLPVLALGIGAQSHAIGNAISIPDGTKRFLRAIEARSPGFGVRGEYTKGIIDGYGVAGARVLGCPSFLINTDRDLWQGIAKRASLGARSRLAIMEGIYPSNWHAVPQTLINVERRLFELVANGADYIAQASHFVLQFARGAGHQVPDSQLETYRHRLAPSMSLAEFRRLMTVHARSNYRVDHWLDAIARYDGVIGTRMHGSILAIQAGTPAIMVTHDSRTAELSQTLQIPTLSTAEFLDTGNIPSLLGKIATLPVHRLDEHRADLARQIRALMQELGIRPSAGFEHLCATSGKVAGTAPSPVLATEKCTDLSLSICLPTNRGRDKSMPAIQRMLEVGLPNGAQLVISDNSLDAAKRTMLRELAARNTQVTLVVHDTMIPASENFQAAFAASTGDLVAFCTDDDVFYPEHFTYAKQFLENNPAYACASGAICCYSSKGPKLFASKEYVGNWDKRILDYLFLKSPGANLMFYGVYRREFIADFYDYLTHHPLPDSFFDFHLPIWALTNGNAHIGSIGMFIYDDCNWSDAATRIATRSRYYEKMGLPGWFTHFHDLYRAIEYFLFLAGNFSSKPTEEKSRLGLEVSSRYFQMWWKSFGAAQQDVPQDVALIVRDAASTADGQKLDIAQIIKLFFAVLTVANAKLAQRYWNFFSANIEI